MLTNAAGPQSLASLLKVVLDAHLTCLMMHAGVVWCTHSANSG